MFFAISITNSLDAKSQCKDESEAMLIENKFTAGLILNALVLIEEESRYEKKEQDLPEMIKDESRRQTRTIMSILNLGAQSIELPDEAA